MAEPTPDEMFAKGATVKKRVLALLEQYPSLRSDHKALWRAYYRRFTGVRFSEKALNAFLFAPSPETISRRAREIQSQREDLKPDDKEQHKRDLLNQAHRVYYSLLTEYGVEA